MAHRPIQVHLQGALGSFTYGRGEQAFKGLFGQVRISPVDPLEITF